MQLGGNYIVKYIGSYNMFIIFSCVMELTVWEVGKHYYLLQ